MYTISSRWLTFLSCFNCSNSVAFRCIIFFLFITTCYSSSWILPFGSFLADKERRDAEKKLQCARSQKQKPELTMKVDNHVCDTLYFYLGFRVCPANFHKESLAWFIIIEECLDVLWADFALTPRLLWSVILVWLFSHVSNVQWCKIVWTQFAHHYPAQRFSIRQNKNYFQWHVTDRPMLVRNYKFQMIQIFLVYHACFEVFVLIMAYE